MPRPVRRPMRPLVLSNLWLCLTLAACSPSTVQDSSAVLRASQEPNEPRQPVPVERRREILKQRGRAPATPAPVTQTTSGEVPALIMALFKEDLAQRALVKPEAITVVSATEITWPDGSLGCGRVGQASTQAVVQGYKVVLSVNDAQYAYHSDLRGAFVVCQQGTPLSPVKDQTRQPLDR